MEFLKPDSLDKVDAEIKFAVVVLCDVIVPSKTEESVETSSFDIDVV